MRYCYLAEPIDATNSRQAHDADMEMFQRGIATYSPRTAWSSCYPPGPEIQQVNNEALKRASVLLAVLPAGVPSIGVPMEMTQARIDRIPVIVLSNRRREDSAALVEFPCEWTDKPDTAAALVKAQLDTNYLSPFLLANRQDDQYTFIKTLNGENQVVETTDPMAHVLWGKYSGGGEAPRTPDYPGDVGYDLTCTMSHWVRPGDQAAIQCSISIQLPPGYWGLIQGRSSSWRRGISVKASIMDAGYRGEVWIDCMNISTEPMVIEFGERIAQLIPMPVVPPIRWEHVDQLDPSVRSDRGYGSTGK